MSASTLLNIFCCRTLSYPTRTRPEFRSGPVPVPVEFGLVPVDFTRPVPRFFFMLNYRFSLFLLMSYLHHVLPSSSLAESSAPLQFPDCITCYPPVPRLYHDITCSPPVPRLYNVLPSSSQTVSVYHVLHSSSQTK